MARIITLIILLFAGAMECQAADTRALTLFAQGFKAQWRWELDEAIKLYGEALNLDSTLAMAYFNRGAAYRSKNMPHEALKDFNSAIENDPQMARAYYGRGRILFEKGRVKAALADMDKTLRIDPNYMGANEIRAKALLALGKYKRAREALTAAMKLSPNDGELYLLRGLARKRLKDFKAAEADLKSAIELNVSGPRAWFELGNLAFLSSQNEEALKRYDRAIAIDPNHAQALNNRGWVKAQLGEFQGAIDDLSGAITQRKDFVAALKNRAWVYTRMDRINEALTDYDAILGLRPDDDKVKTARSRLLQRKKEEKEEKKPELSQRDSEEKVPDSPGADIRALKLSAEEAARAGQYEKAVELYTRVLKYSPNDPSLSAGRGMARMRLKDHKQAAADLEKALRISAEKDNISIRYELGKAYLMDWRLEEAIEQFDRVLEKDAENGLALANRGVAHREAGYLKEAERDFQMALELVKARSRKDKIRRLLKETQRILLGPFRFFDRFYKDNKGSEGQRDFGRDLW